MIKNCFSALSMLDALLIQARRVLVACDFDGTLCSIASSPSEVRITPALLEVLRRMCANDRMSLAVISGRALEDVTARVPIDAIFAGNHGLEIRGRGIHFEHECARRLRPELKRNCEELAEIVRPWPGAWVEDKGLTATVHYRGVDEQQAHAVRCAVRRHIVGRSPSLSLRAGKKALELYPKAAWGKGEALTYIRKNRAPVDVCICLGDDQTDEGMFHESEGQINIKVGPSRPTKAGFHLIDPSGVAVFLAHVLDVCVFSGHAGVAAAG